MMAFPIMMQTNYNIKRDNDIVLTDILNLMETKISQITKQSNII